MYSNKPGLAVRTQLIRQDPKYKRIAISADDRYVQFSTVCKGPSTLVLNVALEGPCKLADSAAARRIIARPYTARWSAVVVADPRSYEVVDLLVRQQLWTVVGRQILQPLDGRYVAAGASATLELFPSKYAGALRVATL